MIATIWEVWNDRHGDLNKINDVSIRFVLLLLESLAINLVFGVNPFLAFNLSFAIHFLFFDYAVAYVLIRDKVVEVPGAHWFSYMGKSGVVDNLKFWRDMNPWLKLLIRLGYFGLALTLIFLK